MKNRQIGARIYSRRKQLGLTMKDIADEIGVAISTIQRYESGSIEKIKLPVIEAIARVLRVDPAWICGKTQDINPYYPKNIVPIETYKIPLIGKIAAGAPILAEENALGDVEAPSGIQASFALLCQGDSMIGANICDGDIVYIREQPTVEPGQIAAVVIDHHGSADESRATLKRVYYTDTSLTLIAENPRYPPLVFERSDMNNVRILGLAVAYTHRLYP